MPKYLKLCCIFEGFIISLYSATVILFLHSRDNTIQTWFPFESSSYYYSCSEHLHCPAADVIQSMSASLFSWTFLLNIRNQASKSYCDNLPPCLKLLYYKGLRTGIVQPEEITFAKQRQGKQLSAVTDAHAASE